MTTARPRWGVYLLIFAYGLILKLLPYLFMQFPEVTRRWGIVIDPQLKTYPWNFSPLLAFGLFSAATLPRKSLGVFAPLLVYLLSDLGIWAITGKLEWAFYPAQIPVYATVALCAMVGWWLRKRPSWTGIAGCSLLSAVLFFTLTNFACWVGNPLYPQNLSGLSECYSSALWHFRNSLVSTLMYSGLLFSPLGVRSRVTASDTAAATVKA
ncbi:MAG: DUF6580 family putative transport protein [Planctomycetaceae bacterium]